MGIESHGSSVLTLVLVEVCITVALYIPRFSSLFLNTTSLTNKCLIQKKTEVEETKTVRNLAASRSK